MQDIGKVGGRVARRVALCLAGLAVAGGSPAAADTVRVSLLSDQTVLEPSESAVVHVLVEVTDGEVGNGVFAYALNVLETLPSVLELVGLAQLGNPGASFSDPGTMSLTGLRDVYGGDGDFFLDPNRGLGKPFAILALEYLAESPGEVTLFAQEADIANFVGVPAGILLQEPGNPAVEFSSELTITVVPEIGLLWLAAAPMAGLVLLRRPRR